MALTGLFTSCFRALKRGGKNAVVVAASGTSSIMYTISFDHVWPVAVVVAVAEYRVFSDIEATARSRSSTPALSSLLAKLHPLTGWLQDSFSRLLDSRVASFPASQCRCLKYSAKSGTV